MEQTSKRKRTSEGEDDMTSASKKQKTKFKRKECVTCTNEVAINRFPKLPHKSAEQHSRDVCFECWEQHLASEIQSKGWDLVCCPLCEESLDGAEIKKLAGSKTYGAWLDKAAKACRENDEEFRSCPSAECNWGCFFSTKEDGNIFTCQMCQHRYCVTCEVPMHEGETCKGYHDRVALKKQQVEENKASEKKVGEISKGCPNCTIRLDKYTGCDHVTCRRCRYEFCWQCFAPYAGADGIRGHRGNNAHATTCRYHPGRLPNVPAAYRD